MMRKTWMLALPLMFLLAACGTTARAASGQHHAKQASSFQTSGATASSTASVATGTVTVGGKSEQVLTTPSGLTLYYFTPDTATKATCSGACAKIWPPLVLGSGQPSGPSGLTGTLGTVQGANGLQVTYNGHPLYAFSGDKKPGQANGEGLQGKWYVATVGLASGAGGGVATSSSSGSSSSGSSGSSGW